MSAEDATQGKGRGGGGGGGGGVAPVGNLPVCLAGNRRRKQTGERRIYGFLEYFCGGTVPGSRDGSV